MDAADTVYLNLAAANRSRTEWSTQLAFEEMRQVPIVNTSDFDLAVSRFSIAGTGAIPLYEAAIQRNQGDPNLTALRMQLKLRFEYSAPIEFPIVLDNSNGAFAVSCTSSPEQRIVYLPSIPISSLADLQLALFTACRDTFPQYNPDLLVWSNDGKRMAAHTVYSDETITLHFGEDSIVPEPARSNTARLIGFIRGADEVVQPGGANTVAQSVPLVAYSTDVAAERYVRWEAEDSTLQVPLPPSANGGTQVSTPYYWCSTVQHLLNLVNKTAAYIMDDSPVNGGGPSPECLLYKVNSWWWGGQPLRLLTKPPQFRYSASGGIISLVADAFGYGGDERTSAGLPQSESYQIVLNLPLYNQVARGLPVKLEADGYALQLAVPLGVEPVNGAWTWASEYGLTSALYTPCESIVFSSQQLPVQPELTSQTDDIAPDASAAANNSLQADFTTMVTDFSIPLSEASEICSGSVYYSPSLLRRESLLRGSNVQNLTVTVAWKHRITGEIIPLRLPPLASAALKLCFIKRNKVMN